MKSSKQCPEVLLQPGHRRRDPRRRGEARELGLAPGGTRGFHAMANEQEEKRAPAFGALESALAPSKRWRASKGRLGGAHGHEGEREEAGRPTAGAAQLPRPGHRAFLFRHRTSSPRRRARRRARRRPRRRRGSTPSGAATTSPSQGTREEQGTQTIVIALISDLIMPIFGVHLVKHA